MDKRSEIMEGFIQFLMLDGLSRKEAEWRAYKQISFLAGLDVVIKVGEISEDLAQTASQPETFMAFTKDSAIVSTDKTNYIVKWFKNTGYVTVEPLIKE